MEANALVAIADTEMSLRESRERYAGNEYSDVTQASAREARQQINGQSSFDITHGLNILCFSDILQDVMEYEGEYRYSDFTMVQSFYEDALKQEKLTNDRLRSQLGAIARDRTIKHEQILGRPEQNDELAIRYASQYMALPSAVNAFIGASPDRLIVLNYPTPNLKYLNLKPDLSRRDPPVAAVETLLARSK